MRKSSKKSVISWKYGFRTTEQQRAEANVANPSCYLNYFFKERGYFSASNFGRVTRHIMAELRAQRGRLSFCQIQVKSRTHSQQEQHYFCLATGTSDSLHFQLIPLSTTFHSVAKAVAEAIVNSLPASKICPSTYLKIGSLKFTLIEMLKEGINLATIERLFFGVRSCVRPGRASSSELAPCRKQMTGSINAREEPPRTWR